MFDKGYEKLDKMNINVGDTVYTLSYPGFGWNQHFRYPILRKHIVTKVTPKRTKIETNNGEFTRECDFYALNDKIINDAKIASNFRFCTQNISSITPEILAKLSDDDLLTVAENIKAISEILQKEEYQSKKSGGRY